MFGICANWQFCLILRPEFFFSALCHGCTGSCTTPQLRILLSFFQVVNSLHKQLYATNEAVTTGVIHQYLGNSLCCQCFHPKHGVGVGQGHIIKQAKWSQREHICILFLRCEKCQCRVFVACSSFSLWLIIAALMPSYVFILLCAFIRCDFCAATGHMVVALFPQCSQAVHIVVLNGY